MAELKRRKYGPYRKRQRTDQNVDDVPTYGLDMNLENSNVMSSSEDSEDENVQLTTPAFNSVCDIVPDNPEVDTSVPGCSQATKDHFSSKEKLQNFLHLNYDSSDSNENDVDSVSDGANLSDYDDEEFGDDLDDIFANVSSREDTYTDKENELLYPGANVTLGAFMLLLALFCTKHNIVGDGIQQLLNIISIILPIGHNLTTSLHAYKMFFKNLKNPLQKHFFCKHCLFPIDQSDLKFCVNEECGKPFDSATGNYFLEMPIINQLKNLFAQDNFFESLNHRFECSVSNNHYEDVYDGSLYKSYFENDGPLNKQENLSFLGNTDGAPVFKSSNVSIWPIFFVINELPYKMRMKKENMILAALWFGNKKPIMSTFLKPVLDSLKQLANGIQVYAPKVGYFISRSFLMCLTCDLPARSLICNSNQYNGSHSCWKCLQQGITAKSGKGHAHVFPFDHASPKGPVRTNESVISDAEIAVNRKLEGKSKTVSHGIKGPSWLILFPRFNIIDGIAIDYMHGVLLGVQKLLLRLWFTPQFSQEPFSFNKSVTSADKKLKMIRPTLDITRLPRSIQNDLKYWKASEFRSFLLYYGSIVMSGILDDQRFSHYLLFVQAIHILLKSGSSEGDIEYAELMLFDFCKRFSELYHEKFMTLNVHQLLHLPDSVRQLGPLYTHSCFSFEDKNGVILKMIRGTQSIDNQITTGISFVQKIPELKQKCIKSGSKVEELYEMIENPYKLKRNLKIGNGVYILGSIKNKKLSFKELAAVVKFIGEAPTSDTFLTFNRVEKDDFVVYGLAYKRMIKRDNSAVCFHAGEEICFGRVKFFIKLTTNEYVALLEELKCNNFNNRSGILSVTLTDCLRVIKLENIKSGCLFISTNIPSKGFVSQFPNRKESD